MQVEVYGSSDDLIEIDGDICEEFQAYLHPDESRLLGFSDGTVLRLTCDEEGIWRIVRIAKGSAKFTKVEIDPNGNEYSERAILQGDIQWVMCSKDYSKTRKKTRKK